MAQSQFVDAGGRRLRHLVMGDGVEAIVLVHGFAGSLESWSANQTALAGMGYTVAALDLPGHGESSLDVGTGSLDDLAAAVLAYMDAAGIRRAHLVGHSMGAATCLVVADREPARVRSLTLLGPAGLGQKINADVIRGLIVARGRDALAPLLQFLFADSSRVGDEMLERLVQYKDRAGTTEALTRIASSRYTATPSGRQLRDIAGSVPALMIWGAEDRMIPAPAPGELARHGVQVRVLPGAGHMVQLEAAGEVNRLVADFLRS